MSNQDSTREPRARKPRLPQYQYDTARSLYFVLDYEVRPGSGYTPGVALAAAANKFAVRRVRRYLNALARLTKTKIVKGESGDAYKAAAYAVGQLRSEGEDVARAVRLLENISEEVRALEAAGRSTNTKTVAAAAPKDESYHVILAISAGNIGYAAGECLSTEPARDSIKVGEPCAAWAGEDDNATTGRVTAADAKTVTLTKSNGETFTFDRRAAAYIGRVTGLCNCAGLDDDDAERVAVLRARIEKLYEPENEAARYKCECEIYAIERRALAANEAPEEWPDVLEEKGGK